MAPFSPNNEPVVLSMGVGAHKCPHGYTNRSKMIVTICKGSNDNISDATSSYKCWVICQLHDINIGPTEHGEPGASSSSNK